MLCLGDASRNRGQRSPTGVAEAMAVSSTDVVCTDRWRLLFPLPTAFWRLTPEQDIGQGAVMARHMICVRTIPDAPISPGNDQSVISDHKTIVAAAIPE